MVDRPPGWTPPGAEPFAVQAEAFRRGSDREKYGYFLEQGLGKSGVLCKDYMKQVILDRIVGLAILAPSYLKSGWRDEWRNWEVPFPLFTWPDVPPVGDRRYREPHGIVFNYESILYSGGDHLEALLKSGVPYMVAADESRAIANPSGRWNGRAMYLRTHGTQLRALCGAPWTNSIMDLYAQLRWCGALSGWNPYQFRNRFARMGGFMGKQVVGVQEDREAELHEIIASCGMRALKVDWWDDMPPKIWPAPLEFEMSRDQGRMYGEMLRDYAAVLPGRPEDDEAVVYAAHAANAYQKLQQISRGYVIDGDGAARPIFGSGRENPALRLVRRAVDDVDGKLIIFAFHRHSVDALSEALRAVPHVIMRGGMSDREVEAVKASFNGDDEIRVIIAQLTVGARGHTLLGSVARRCSTTMYYETVFDADLMWQSTDRNHRYGQDRAVVYHTLRCSSIDDRIADSLGRKGDLVATFLDAVRSTPR